MLQSLVIGSLTLTDAPYTVESYSFPDAELNAFGRSAQLSGAPRKESHYDDPPWQLVVVVSSPTTALLDALYEAVQAGAWVTLTEPTGTARSRLTSAYSTAAEHHGFVRVMFSGDRRPAWVGGSTEFSLTVTGGWGSADLPTVGGTLCADIELNAACDSASTLLAVGIAHDPQTGYDPIDGGSWSADVTLDGTYKLLATPSDIDVTANRGSHYAVAMVRHKATSAGAVRYRAESTLAAVTVTAPSVASGVAYTSGDGAVETVVAGRVDIPAAQMPNATAGTLYGATTRLVDVMTSGTNKTWALNNYPQSYIEIYQSFTFAVPARLAWVTVPVYTDAACYGEIWIANTSGGNPSTYVAKLGNIPKAQTYGKGYTAGFDLPAGTYAIVARVWLSTFSIDGGHDSGEVVWTRNASAPYADGRGGYRYAHSTSDWTIGDGADTTVDYYCWVYHAPILSFNASTPLRATCSQSSKTANIHTLARIPADHGAVIATGTFNANEGWYHDAASGSVYPADSTGVRGSALSPLRAGEFVVPPGANKLVTACSALDDVTLNGVITELRIARG